MSSRAHVADGTLVELARGGDQAAFAVLVARHRTMAWRLCRQVLRDRARAEDGVQEAVLLAWLNLDKLRQAERFGPWLAGIALRVCHGWLRYRAPQAWSLEALLGGGALPEPADWAATPLRSVEQAELGAAVRRAVAELPRGQRTAVTLFYLAGLSHAEIATQLAAPIGTVKGRIRLALDRLRVALGVSPGSLRSQGSGVDAGPGLA